MQSLRSYAFTTLVPLLMMGSSALAADLGEPVNYEREWVEHRPYNWTGFYIGGNLGGAWSNVDLSIVPANVPIWNKTSSGFIGGGQLGYNYQIDRLVLGAEANFDWTSIGKTATIANLQGSVETRWVSTVAGRAGFAADNWLFFGKGGWAWADYSAKLTDLTTNQSIERSKTSTGWVAGGGVEYGFNRNWTVKVEYDYIGLKDWQSPSVANQSLNVSHDVQMFTVGLNYKF